MKNHIYSQNTEIYACVDPENFVRRGSDNVLFF